jgi:hypothetical protein
MQFFYGIDLGQSQDFSAAVILEAHGESGTHTYDARHIEQWPLGTPYPSIVADVRATMDRYPLRGQCRLCIDHTGVGRPLYDMFMEARLQPIGITITGGAGWYRETGRQWHVSKVMLVGTVQKFLQSGRLRIGRTLKHAGTLQKELRDFRVQVSKAANEIYGAREGAHDDLTLALACALFVAENPGPRFVPVGD